MESDDLTEAEMVRARTARSRERKAMTEY